MGNCCASNDDLPVHQVEKKKNIAVMSTGVYGSLDNAMNQEAEVEAALPTPEPVKEPLADLDVPKKWGFSDEICKFERALPFARIDVKTCFDLIDLAAGDESVVTLEQLSEHFDSPAW